LHGLLYSHGLTALVAKEDIHHIELKELIPELTVRADDAQDIPSMIR
jgi:hypothetical protein